MAKNQSGCFSTILLQFFKGASAHDVDVDVDGAVDDRLRIGLIEQVHEDAAILHGDAGVGGYRVAIDEAAVGGGDIQQAYATNPLPAKNSCIVHGAFDKFT